MPNLRFLKVYKSKDDGNDILHIPEETEFPRRLRLLHWEAYPSKSLPLRLCLKNLVELNMRKSLVEKLWEGTQQLTNLKKMDFSWSMNLKELPDLSNAAMLERLQVRGCKSLVEIHSSIGNLHKISYLDMSYCTKLQVVPARFNLAPLAEVDMIRCSQLRNFPDISSNITYLHIPDTMLEELPKSVRRWSALRFLYIFGDRIKIERIPDCIKDFHELRLLWVVECSKLASLPELPVSLEVLIAESCESLKTVSYDFDPVLVCTFSNCFNLGREARRVIQQSLLACLPGRKVPAEFDHRALGNSLTIRSDFSELRICVVVSPKQETEEHYLKKMWCRVRINKGCLTECHIFPHLHKFQFQTEHLCFCYANFVGEDGWLEQDNEIMLEFITCQGFEIVECGVQIMTEESERRRVEFDEASRAFLNSEETHGSISSDRSYEQMFEDDSEDDGESLFDGSYDEFDEASKASLNSEETHGSISSDGIYEQMSEDDGESLFDGSYDEFDEASKASLNSELTDGLICNTKEDNNGEAENRTDCWSWLLLCLDLSSLVRSTASLLWGGRR